MHQALQETGGSAAHAIGIWLALAGLALLLYECFFQGNSGSSNKGIYGRYKELVKQRNAEFDRKYKASLLDEEGKSSVSGEQ